MIGFTLLQFDHEVQGRGGPHPDAGFGGVALDRRPGLLSARLL